MNAPSTLLPFLCTCLSSILIGSAAVFVRLVDLPPATMGFYRMLVSLPFLALWMKWEKQNISFYPPLSLQGKVGIVLAGMFFAFNIALWNWAVGETTIVNANLLNNTAAFFIPLTLWILFKQKPSVKVVVSVCIGFMGCFLLLGENFFNNSSHTLGDMASILSGLMVAFYMIALNQVRNHVMTGFLMFWISISATFFLGLCAYLTGTLLHLCTLQGGMSIVAQALLVQVLGQGLLAYSLGRISPTYAGIILFLSPVTGAMIGQFFYGENLSAVKLFGMGLVMVSIVVMRKE